MRKVSFKELGDLRFHILMKSSFATSSKTFDYTVNSVHFQFHMEITVPHIRRGIYDVPQHLSLESLYYYVYCSVWCSPIAFVLFLLVQ